MMLCILLLVGLVLIIENVFNYNGWLNVMMGVRILWDLV